MSMLLHVHVHVTGIVLCMSMLLYVYISCCPVCCAVEVFIGGAWGSLCDVAFGYREADVICKQLGFPSVLRFYLGSQ